MFKQAIIHCSDSTFGTASMIDIWHKDRGFNAIGYHYVILNGIPYKDSPHRDYLNGSIEVGRKDTIEGAHCIGHNNALGVCLIGKDTFTGMQFMSLGRLLKGYGISKENVFPHNKFSEKTCPNFDVEEFKNKYL